MGLKLVAVIWFHVAWLACVHSANNDWSGFSLLLPLVTWMILFFSERPRLAAAGLLLTFALTGVLFDGAATSLGLVTFSKAAEFIVPPWIVSMWFLFVAIIPIAAETFRNRLWLASFLGAIFGPLSYQSGSAFGVLTLNGTTAIAIYAVFWALFFPLFIRLYKAVQ